MAKSSVLNQCRISAGNASDDQRWARLWVVRARTPLPMTAANQPGAKARVISGNFG